MSNPIDKKLQDLATTDWQEFLRIVGEDFIFTARARILRSEGQSWQQISTKLESTPAKARNACKKLSC